MTVGEEDGAFFVRDQGVGFDMAHAHKLFVAFERLVGQEVRGHGRGARERQADRREARRDACGRSREPGKGATFWFTLG